MANIQRDMRIKNKPSLTFHMQYYAEAAQGRSQPNTAGVGGSEKIPGGAKYSSSFLKFEVKK